MSLKTAEWHLRRFHDRDFSRDDRVEYSKDYDRILYSTAFRRLGGVTQVVPSNEIALFHTRLTHSLKTAQVGTRLTNHLLEEYHTPRWQKIIIEHGGLESRIVRSACLAHDLGHPPFGHIAAAELRRITSRWPNEARPRRKDGGSTIELSPKIDRAYELRDRFDGTAQSFRIVTKLASREPPEHEEECPALNLTRGTLAAMLKYPWSSGNSPREPKTDLREEKRDRWGYYDSEHEIVTWIFADSGQPLKREVNLRDRKYEYRTLEAQVMDWADDISYAVHDVEDFFRAGVIPLDRLAVSPNEWEDFFEYAWQKKLSCLFDESEREEIKRLGEESRVSQFCGVGRAGPGGVSAGCWVRRRG
jgi:dGTPase